MQIGILGSGDYATALAYRFSNSHNVVNWYIRRQGDRERLLSTEHHKHFSNYKFNMNYVNVMSDVMSVVLKSDIIILAIPSAYIDDELNSMWFRDYDIPSKPWVVMSKGLVSISSIMKCDIITEYLQMILNGEWSDIFVLSGPSHAEEIIMGKFSALGCAHSQCTHTHKSRGGVDIQNLFKDINIHISSESIDTGVLQYSSILKNIYGIGAGIVDSLNAGDNTKALFSTMCINELSSFLMNLYPDYEYYEYAVRGNLYTVGDILVTMYSNHSRNYRLGRNVVDGNIPAPGEKCQVEGFNTITTLHQCTTVDPKIRKLKELPVVRFVSDCIYKASGNRERIEDMLHKLLYSHL